MRPDAVYDNEDFLYNVSLYNDVVIGPVVRPPSLEVGVTRIVRQPASDPIIRAKPEGAPLRAIDTMERWTSKRLREP